MSIFKIWLRLLIPSWRFFDGLDQVASLEYRAGSAAEQLGPWTSPRPAPELKWHNLFINAERNLHLARQSLVDQFVENFADGKGRAESEVFGSSHYQWLRNSVMWELKEPPKPAFFQFRIRLHQISTKISNDDFFVSAVEKADPQ